MLLFENADNEIEKQRAIRESIENDYTNIVEYCVSNGIRLNKDQMNELHYVIEDCCEAPSSDNSAIKDVEFKTTANSQDDEVVDASKGDSSQKGADPCPEHIEDAIEKEENNDEFVNDYDQDVKKNESYVDSTDYCNVLETFVRNGVQLDDEQLENLKEEFLLEATDAKKSRRKFIDDIRRKVQKIFSEEGIRMFLQDTPNSKKFKNGETDTFNLRFDQESKGLRIAAGILTYGASELNRALYQQGSQTSVATQNAIQQFIEDCEDDIAEAIEEAGSDNGFDAELVRISINGIKIKAVLKEDGWNALKDRKENKKAHRVDAKETRKEIKASEKSEEKEAKRRGR